MLPLPEGHVKRCFVRVTNVTRKDSNIDNGAGEGEDDGGEKQRQKETETEGAEGERGYHKGRHKLFEPLPLVICN